MASTFSLLKISNHFFNALLNASYFSDLALLAPRLFSYDWKIFSFFFQMEKVFLVLPKSETISLWGVPFLSSLRDLNLTFKDSPEGWCFAAEMVVMSDV